MNNFLIGIADRWLGGRPPLKREACLTFVYTMHSERVVVRVVVGMMMRMAQLSSTF